MNIFSWITTQRTRYILKHHAIPHKVWQAVMHESILFRHLSSVEKSHLHTLTTLFIYRKTFTGTHDFKLTDKMLVIIAAQACLLVLKLGLKYFNGWVEIIIYPDAFRVKHENTDESGLASNESHVLSGEAWLRGPVILSWQDIADNYYSPHPGHNVVLHEFSHKLDMLNGRANGMPPLHPKMEIEQWTNALSHAFTTLEQSIVRHHPTYINPYAATNPAEFFAVISEYFFTAPNILKQYCPEVFTQLSAFYLQDPKRRPK